MDFRVSHLSSSARFFEQFFYPRRGLARQTFSVDGSGGNYRMMITHLGYGSNLRAPVSAARERDEVLLITAPHYISGQPNF
ncbi:unnamed protein product [Calypogeia fissa]